MVCCHLQFAVVKWLTSLGVPAAVRSGVPANAAADKQDLTTTRYYIVLIDASKSSIHSLFVCILYTSRAILTGTGTSLDFQAFELPPSSDRPRNHRFPPCPPHSHCEFCALCHLFYFFHHDRCGKFVQGPLSLPSMLATIAGMGIVSPGRSRNTVVVGVLFSIAACGAIFPFYWSRSGPKVIPLRSKFVGRGRLSHSHRSAHWAVSRHVFNGSLLELLEGS